MKCVWLRNNNWIKTWIYILQMKKIFSYFQCLNPISNICLITLEVPSLASPMKDEETETLLLIQEMRWRLSVTRSPYFHLEQGRI